MKKKMAIANVMLINVGDFGNSTLNIGHLVNQTSAVMEHMIATSKNSVE